ncbi:DsbA family oxidoreductase [Micromonospora sp. DT48]|uniref:DsbA family oxidoreductase n=1 Tax=Micromonospora sp. DT48 TaxID=3393429 RepID=UPI003CF2532C
MEIDIYADLVCPWCWIGRRRLTQALASYEGKVTIRNRPFQLDPSPVPSPRPMLDVLAEKFGGREQVRQMVDRVVEVGASVGLDLRYDRMIAANIFDAHRLTNWAGQQDRDGELVEALHRAHFTDGVDIGSREALAEVAATVGLDGDDARHFLDSEQGVAELTAELAAARQLGVTSVPTFVLAGKYAITGAQEADTLLAALAEVERREAAAS